MVFLQFIQYLFGDYRATPIWAGTFPSSFPDVVSQCFSDCPVGVGGVSTVSYLGYWGSPVPQSCSLLALMLPKPYSSLSLPLQAPHNGPWSQGPHPHQGPCLESTCTLPLPSRLRVIRSNAWKSMKHGGRVRQECCSWTHHCLLCLCCLLLSRDVLFLCAKWNKQVLPCLPARAKLNERSQTKKDKQSVLPLICGAQNEINEHI